MRQHCGAYQICGTLLSMSFVKQHNMQTRCPMFADAVVFASCYRTYQEAHIPSKCDIDTCIKLEEGKTDPQ